MSGRVYGFTCTRPVPDPKAPRHRGDVTRLYYGKGLRLGCTRYMHICTRNPRDHGQRRARFAPRSTPFRLTVQSLYKSCAGDTGLSCEHGHVFARRPRACPQERGRHQVVHVTSRAQPYDGSHPFKQPGVFLWFAVDHPRRRRLHYPGAGLALHPGWVCWRLVAQGLPHVWTCATTPGGGLSSLAAARTARLREEMGCRL